MSPQSELKMTLIYTLTTWIIPLLLCIILHEVAHGYVAYKLGDKTAWLLGRLNLNPIRHFDPIGSALVPGFLWRSHRHGKDDGFQDICQG